MSVQKNIMLQVNNSMEKMKKDFDPLSSTKDCDINIQVANGWAITGHYQNNTLQTLTLQKTAQSEE
jgi:hypothetical protein